MKGVGCHELNSGLDWLMMHDFSQTFLNKENSFISCDTSPGTLVISVANRKLALGLLHVISATK